MCSGSPSKDAYQRTNGRWTIGDGSHLSTKRIMGMTQSLDKCEITHEIDVAALYLSGRLDHIGLKRWRWLRLVLAMLAAIYFDHVSGNHYHWMADGLMHLFGGLVDSGLIDPKTSTINMNYTLAIFGPHRNYKASPPPESFSTLVNLLTPNGKSLSVWKLFLAQFPSK